MRGKFTHNRCLIEPIAAAFARLGGCVHREFPIRPGRYPRYADLVVDLDGKTIVVEGESSSDRVPNDVNKAAALKALLLLFVTPHRSSGLVSVGILPVSSPTTS